MRISGSRPGANTINVGGAMDVAYDGIGNDAHSVAGGTVFGDTGGTGITSILPVVLVVQLELSVLILMDLVVLVLSRVVLVLVSL